MPQKKSAAYRIGYRMGSLGTRSGKRAGSSGSRKPPSPKVLGGVVAVIAVLIIIGLAAGGGSRNHLPSGPPASNDVTVDSCQQDPQTLEMVALGRITNSASSSQDYQLFVTYLNGNNELITSSKVESFTNLAPGQTDEFNLTKSASGTVDGLTCKPEVTRSPSSRS